MNSSKIKVLIVLKVKLNLSDLEGRRVGKVAGKKRGMQGWKK